MKTIIITLFALICAITAAEAAKKKRTHVVVPKPYPIQPTPLQTFGALAFVAPPLLVFYDLNRRVNCLNPPDPYGLGGPGFDGKPTPPTNVMIPACERMLYRPR